MEDDRIVELYWQREETAVARTREKYGVRLYRLAFSILRNSEDAEEAESDTYLKAWNAMPPARPARLYGFLAKLCRQAAFDRLDWLNAGKRDAEITELTREMAECIPDAAAERALEGAELGRLLSDFLLAQSPENRLIFTRRYFMADSVRAIADYCHISESKVKSSLFRTRNRLREYLQKEGVIDP